MTDPCPKVLLAKNGNDRGPCKHQAGHHHPCGNATCHQCATPLILGIAPPSVVQRGVGLCSRCCASDKSGVSVAKLDERRRLRTERTEKIVSMLAEGCWTLQEVGNAFGVSRERVRQIASKQPSFNGRERRRECTLKERQAKLAARHTWLVNALHREKLPYQLQAAMKVLVNDYRCFVIVASQAGDIWRFTTPVHREEFDFVLIRLSTDFLVVPATMPMPLNTMTKLCKKKGRGINWRSYLNNWDQLRGKVAEEPVLIPKTSFTFYMPTTELAQLKAAATAQAIPTGELARNIIGNWLTNESKEANFISAVWDKINSTESQ